MTKNSQLKTLLRRVFRIWPLFSYGIYIFHSFPIALAIVLAEPFQAPSLVLSVFVYIVSIGLTILLAHLSFKYFESGFLRRKEKYGYGKPTPQPGPGRQGRQEGVPLGDLGF